MSGGDVVLSGRRRGNEDEDVEDVEEVKEVVDVV